MSQPRVCPKTLEKNRNCFYIRRVCIKYANQFTMLCVTFQSNMASILLLTDDCLHKIVSYIDDPNSFYNIALTCQRLLQVTRNTRSVLHTNLLRAKAEYYIKCFTVENGDDYEAFSKVEAFLLEASRLTEAKGMLSYDKVVDIWQRNGPVVAKLFTWLRSKESSVEEGEPRATCFTESRKVTLCLPSSGKTMVIETSYFRDYNHVYDPELSIHLTCGDLDVTSEGFTHYSPEDYMYWQENEVSRAVQPMKVIIELLQKELGETVPQISSRFFIWLCYLFPDESNLDEAHRLNFKDDGRNMKPTYASVQTTIDQFRKDQQIDGKLQRLMSGWKSDDDQKSKFSRMAAETVIILAQKSKTNILKRLKEDASRFHGIATDYDMKKLPKQLLLDLILRLSLKESGYDAASIADKCVESTVFFRCPGNKPMKVCGSMRGDGAGLPSWEEIELEFTLPDGKVLVLKGENGPLKIEDLSPVTELLRQGFSQQRQGEKLISKIGNLFTAAFFLTTLEFNVDSDAFLGGYNKLIQSDSEEESSAAESSGESEP